MNNNIPVTNLAVGDFTIIRIPLTGVDEQDLEAVALRLSDLAGFEIVEHPGEWTVTISALSQAGISAADIACHFSNGLIDQKLRRRIAEQTATERNLILSYAFSNTQLINNNEA